MREGVLQNQREDHLILTKYEAVRDGRFGKLFLIRDANNIDKIQTVSTLSNMFAGKFTHIISKRI